MKSSNIRSSFGGSSDGAFGLDAARDHRAGAAADQIARGVVVDRRQSLAREHHVEGVDEIGRGIDQGAVEVENDGPGGHGGSS